TVADAGPRKEHHHMSRWIAFASLLVAASVHAEPLAGTIDEPALRRKIDLVYVESVPWKVELPKDSPMVNQRNNVYQPHLLVVVQGTKVIFQSEDSNIHKEMSAWVVVLQKPYYARPDKAGNFKIDGLKPGSYTVRIWGEALSDE